MMEKGKCKGIQCMDHQSKMLARWKRIVSKTNLPSYTYYWTKNNVMFNPFLLSYEMIHHIPVLENVMAL